MRLASFLPMLLLAFSIPVAAQNCNIFDLTATIVQANPNTCEFFVSLKFQHDGTSVHYTVKGNGNNYGTFLYAQNPLVLGPFNADPNAPTSLEFVVADSEFSDCQDVVQIMVPACANPNICSIKNLIVETGQCDPFGLSYQLGLNFQVQAPGAGNSFQLWANGVLLGNFPLAGLPLLIPAFPASGNAFDVLKICINGQPDCCETRDIQAPDCVNPPCEIVDLSVQTGDCTSDSTYKATINFHTPNPVLIDSFALWSNGHFVGTYGLNQLPFMFNAEWNGGLKDDIKVCLGPNGQVNGCCKTLEYAVPNCLNSEPCAIKDLSVKVDTCTSDSTFLAILNFVVDDPSAVDSFELSANGQSLGHFGLNQLPLHIEDFPWNGLIFNQVRVCTGNSPTCCKEFQFLAPACLPFGPCEITDIFLQTGPCTSDSTYKINLNFNGTNPGNGTFTVSIHNQLLDTFNLSQVPLMLEVPWNGQAGDFITVCILGANSVPGTAGCCRIKQFQTPNCFQPCNIFDVTLDPGDCNPNSNTYKLGLNFAVQNPGNGFFEVWGNGDYLGIFPLASLPLVIPNFPSNGNAMDIIKICINDHPDCCKSIDFQGLNCDAPCEIFDVVVDPGDCNNNGTYNLHLNFHVQNPGNALFEVFGNGVSLGLFPLNALPVLIPNFPSNGNAVDILKICINDQPNCCKTVDFQGPNCDAPCEIFDLVVETGDCHPADSTYTVRVNFQVQNPSSNTFGLWANGQFFGNYNLSQLPLEIPNFPWDGTGPNDVIKVCIVSNVGTLTCCRTIEYPAPNCFPNNCDVKDLTVQTGDCTGDSTYKVVVNFQVVNPPSNVFSLWANGQFYGLFNVNQLPLPLQNFPWNGGAFDHIKVCFANASGGQGACCADVEYHVPDCLLSDPCEIFDLSATPGDCDPNAPFYPLTINFEVANPGNTLFEVWVNGVYFGAHPLTALPFTIPNAPSNGNAGDILKVCINDHPDCCKILEFPGPICNGGGNCEIFDVVLDPGDCNPLTNQYSLLVKFQVVNPDNDFFEVWGNGQYLGMYPIAGLPTLIQDFPSNGAAFDVIKICIKNHPDCCKTIEFDGPNCGGNGNCEIFDLVLDPGQCTGDSSYHLAVNFQVINPPSNGFQVWANGQLFGNYNLNQLPLLIPNFPWNGGNFDGIKICLLPNTPGTPICCIGKEFQVPSCLTGNGDCHIYDLQVLKTTCLCGQFFAVLTFQHENGGSGGFDIVGNGTNYGNFPYDTIQPIIIGPLPGDGTNYEFAVVDHNHPDQCGDDANLGEVTCMNAVIDVHHSSSKLTLSPNPTADWLNVTALLENGAAIGQANVEVYASDGRMVLTHTVANGANFQLDVSNLPSGVYRIVLKSNSGSLEGKFAKQ